MRKQQLSLDFFFFDGGREMYRVPSNECIVCSPFTDGEESSAGRQP